jgi:hypothetical protein
MTLAGLAVLVCAASYAASAITVRILGKTDSTPSMVFWVMLVIAVGAGLLAIPDWRPIQPEHWKVIGAVALTGSLGQWALTEAFRRAVLRRFVRRGLFERDDAAAMLAWPHSGFHVHDAVLVPDGDLAFALRLARYCARNPVALERLDYDAAQRQVHYRSDKTDGPTAGTETVDPLEFLARLTAHIPDKRQVMTRYYGFYANRVRGARRRRGEPAPGPPPVAEPVPLAWREARRRWAELLRQIFEVDPLRCPACGAAMRIVAVITQRAVIDRMLDHLRRTREAARAPPGTGRHARQTAQRVRP